MLILLFGFGPNEAPADIYVLSVVNCATTNLYLLLSKLKQTRLLSGSG